MGYDLSAKIYLSVFSRDFPAEVKQDVLGRAVKFLYRVTHYYQDLPVPARRVYETYVRQDVAVSRSIARREPGGAERRRSGRTAVGAVWTAVLPEGDACVVPDLTPDERYRTVHAATQTSDLLFNSLVGLGVEESDALLEAVESFLTIFDLVSPLAGD